MLRSRLARLEEKREAEQLFPSTAKNWIWLTNSKLFPPPGSACEGSADRSLRRASRVYWTALDNFLNAYLRWKASDAAPVAADDELAT